ncbi:1-phosphofructokinase [Dictyobacter formicarum]|uniref:1-phosphofructokinase n=1 Tax=Dictyobacter formicarum TaxID=2778368 RepID=A0ABQ3V8Z4_9CHLR|nr:1-phosphofructokinase [Dictyobacter formicarum]GHO82133.1 1-phosphofructokinase [Dictyobacter formicarum]
MSKIATITLNPAIDLTVRVDHFQPATVNRGQEMQLDAGGKGVNVASFLADYGHATAVTGFLGRDNATIFEQLFRQKQIEDAFIRLPGQTRTGIKVIDEARRQTTDINMPGLQPSAADVEQLTARIEQLAATCDWFVLAGHLPPGLPTNFYATTIERLKTLGKNIVLDSSQAALRAGAQAGPTILKPNIDELQQLVERPLEDELSIEQGARQLLQDTVRLVVVSMGEHGALFVDQHTTLVAQPLAVSVKSTVGAGDAMVAGLIAGLNEGLPLAECARLATAFSAGTITRIGPHLPDRHTLQQYASQVQIRTLQPASKAQEE